MTRRICTVCLHPEFGDDGRPTHTYSFCWYSDECNKQHVFAPIELGAATGASPEL